MIFAPHILQVKVITPMDKDEFGRPIPGTGGDNFYLQYVWSEYHKKVTLGLLLSSSFKPYCLHSHEYNFIRLST